MKREPEIGRARSRRSHEFTFKCSAGAVLIFDRVAPSWVFRAFVKASNTDMFDWFGRDIVLDASGDVLDDRNRTLWVA